MGLSGGRGACRGEDYRKVWGCGGILLGHSKEVGGDTHLNQGGWGSGE